MTKINYMARARRKLFELDDKSQPAGQTLQLIGLLYRVLKTCPQHSGCDYSNSKVNVL